MPEICRFFGIIIRMFFDEHDPPHFHAEYQGGKICENLGTPYQLLFQKPG